jgi:hypothetical protein
MITLQKITTVYVDKEDRIRLTGALQNGDTIVIWLTQRLLQLLVPSLSNWLQKSDTVAGAALGAEKDVQSFRQQAAKASIEKQPPVAPTGQSLIWVAVGVDYRSNNSQIHLIFKGQNSEAASLDLPLAACRQWLSIVFDAYKLASWPMTAWPDWIAESAAPPTGALIVRH